MKSAYDVTDNRARVMSYADSIYLWYGDDIFRTLERIESKQPYFTVSTSPPNTSH